MTPDLMEEGSRALDKAKGQVSTGSESGGREAAYGRVLQPDQLDVSHGSILYLEDIEVSFDGFKALNKLNLNIASGEMRCIIGPNGAGKTTMMDVITGKTRPSPRSASAASSRSPRCSSSSACSRTWSWRSRPTAAPVLLSSSSSTASSWTASPPCCSSST